MNSIAAIGFGILLAGLSAGQDAVTQAAACPAPQPPPVERPVKPERPPTPSCVNEARGTHTCNNRTLNAYQQASTAYQQSFTAYVAQVNAYLQRLEAYTRESVAYAECERDIVLPSPIISG
ncbi:MAG: hypothetical protein ACLGG3_02095 [Alphaproteobacteria bacterium]